MGDAISHAAFPGVVAAYLLKGPFYLGAVIAAVGTALAIGWIGRRGNLRGDTVIGVLFAGMFALGVFLFSTIRNYVGDLFGFLFGEVLGISPTDLLALSILAGIVLVIVVVLWKELLYSTFDPLGAAASGLPVVAPRVPVPRPHRADDRGQPPGGRDHPRRRDARDAGRHRPAAHAPVRPADGDRGAHRGGQPGRRPVPELLAQHGERGDDRPRRDGRVPASRSSSGRGRASSGHGPRRSNAPDDRLQRARPRPRRLPRRAVPGRLDGRPQHRRLRPGPPLLRAAHRGHARPRARADGPGLGPGARPDHGAAGDRRSRRRPRRPCSCSTGTIAATRSTRSSNRRRARPRSRTTRPATRSSWPSTSSPTGRSPTRSSIAGGRRSSSRSSARWRS